MKAKAFPIAVAAVAVLALSACKEEYQDRVLRWEPGVYKGQPDQAIGEDVRRELNDRARYQGSFSSRSAGGISVNKDAVRPPEQPSETARQLQERTSMQNN
ncbi:MAG: hypothetical protein ACPGOV_13250 [Magnetovibrionaceae bacterium]